MQLTELRRDHGGEQFPHLTGKFIWASLQPNVGAEEFFFRQ
jgi:hypothetical protein